MAFAPKFVLVMRHAEKPEAPDNFHLSPEGYERAERLAEYIPATFGTPDFIIAAAISKDSARPYETVEPLAHRTGKDIDDTIEDKHYEVLARNLLTGGSYSRREVVVCWHHGHIPSLLHALGAKRGDYPDPWDPEVFNLILKVDFADSGEPKVSKVSKVKEPF